MDKGPRGRWRNTTLHLSLMSVGYFWIHTLKVNIFHASVVFGREVFGEAIGKIFSYLLPVEADFFCLVKHHIQLKRTSKNLERFRSMSPVRMLWEVALSVLIGVDGCGWTISIRFVRMGTD